ncbi:MAG: winged helix-turn-helix transcriptional regulator [Rhodobacterales bacterium]|nr:winged helix-turn-helix transcriptional regulator [Rhodobacterales bacterium]
MATTHGTDGGAPGTYVLEDQPGFLLRLAHQRASAVFQEVLEGRNLTPTQFAALVKLGDTGGASQNHLGRLTGMDRATIQGVIRRLTDRGLIDNAADPNDRRRRHLMLSTAGRDLVENLLCEGQTVSKRILDPLKPFERKQLIRLLRRLS